MAQGHKGNVESCAPMKKGKVCYSDRVSVEGMTKNDFTQAAQLIAAFGNRQKADEALDSVYKFVVLRKTA